MYSFARAVVLFCAVSVFCNTRAFAAENTPPKLKEVIIVCKTHFDIGYTDLARNVLQKYRTTMIDKALDVCDATREFPEDQQFAWTLPGWPLSQILWPEQEPARRARIEDAIKRGRFVWHALPFTTHTESLDLEDLVRGMRFSSDLARKYGQPLPRDAKMTDVPSHCWGLPTVLANAGVEFLHLGCNGGSTHPEAPPLFWWEGPDGSRVMTMLVLGYGTGLQPPADWPYQTWLALIHTGDNHGPPTPEEVKKLIAEANAKFPGVKVRMGRLSDFADAIRRENAQLPVVRADMPDTWIHGIMSHPDDTAIARRTRPQIGQLEALHTLMANWGVSDLPEVKQTVAKAYEQSLLYGEHTWGYDAKRFPRLYGKAWEAEYAKGTYAKAEDSWAEHGNYIRSAQKLVQPALTDHLGRLTREVAVKGPRVVVFNPLPWKRDAVVSLEQNAKGTLRDSDTGKTVTVERSGDKLRFLARDLPPMGYKTYSIDAANAQEPAPALSIDDKQGVIDNGLLRVKVDAARGGISSIVDVRSGRECVAAGEVLGQYLYQRFDAEDPKRYVAQYAKSKASWIEGDFGKPGMPPATEVPRVDAVASNFDLRMETGPISARAILTAKPTEAVPHAVSLVVTLYRDAAYVDVEWSIKDKKPTPWPEAGWLCLPLAVKDASYRLGRPGAIVDPAKDLQPGSNRDIFCLQSGLTVTGSDGSLVGICPVDSPLVSIGKPGLWKFTHDFNPAKPTIYVNLYNNQWSTNFSQWVGGSWSSTVRIWAGQADQANSILAVAAAETRSPALAAFADGPAGRLPASDSGLSVSRPSIAVTAFGANPDGDGTLLRIWEQSGQPGTCAVTLPRGSTFKTAQPCNLRGEPAGAAISIEDGKINCEVKAFGPRSFILE